MKNNQARTNIVRAETEWVLVVESKPAIQSTVEAGFDIRTATGQSSALKKVCEPFPKAVLISRSLKEGNPFNLCKTIKANHATAHIPVLLVAPQVTEEFEIEGLMNRANGVFSESSSEELIRIRIERISARLANRYHRSNFLEELDRVLLAALELENLRVEDLADYFNMDRKTLYLRVTKESGLCPQNYIRNLRIGRAGYLLKKGAMTVSEVAFQVGFKDHSYFTRCFKEYFRKTPSEFLKAC